MMEILHYCLIWLGLGLIGFLLGITREGYRRRSSGESYLKDLLFFNTLWALILNLVGGPITLAYQIFRNGT